MIYYDLTKTMQEEQTKALAVIEPTRIKVGNTYEMMYQGMIISVTVQKIVVDSSNQVQGFILTKLADKGFLRFLRDEAITISAAEMKSRVLTGGVKEVVL